MASNIFAQYTQPLRSVQDYSNEMARGEFLDNQTAMQRMTMQQGQQQQAAAQARQNALMQVANETGGDPDKMVPALYRRGFVAEAQSIEKERAAVGKTKADAAKVQGETVDGALKRYQGMLSYIDTPQGAARWLQAQYQDPATGPVLQSIRPFEEAVQGIPADPAQFQQWRLQAGVGMEKVAQWAKEKQIADDRNATQVTTTRMTNETSTENNKRSVGAQYAIAGATRAAGEAARDAAVTRDKRDTEMKLADDYRQQSKLFAETKSAHSQIMSALPSATKSPVATLAAATKFMKIIDPGSVVRESELGMALAASGVIDRATNYVNTLQRGKVLTETQAKDFENIAGKIYDAAKTVQRDIDKSYGDKAKAYGLRPEMVTQDLGQNSTVMEWGDLK